jgi:hypothetical protein
MRFCHDYFALRAHTVCATILSKVNNMSKHLKKTTLTKCAN